MRQGKEEEVDDGKRGDVRGKSKGSEMTSGSITSSENG